MASVVVVHGTGVRHDRSTALVSAVRRHLTSGAADDPVVVSCDWGESVGARLRRGGASLPSAHSQGQDAQLARWARLYADPLYELAALGAASSPASFLATDTGLPSWLRRLAADPSFAPAVAGAMSDAGLLAIFTSACAEVASTVEFADAARHAGEAVDILVETVSRAVVATVILRAGDQDGDAVLAADARDRLVEALVAAFDGRHLSLQSQAVQATLKVVDRVGVGRWMQRQRRPMAMFAADIALYQSHGHDLRHHVRATVARAALLSTPVVIVGHSLGGIISFEALVEARVPDVGLLVTVGSQAPFLYEVDALTTLPFGKPMPVHMPAWLNIWDQADLLSTLAEPIFGPRQVTDEAVRNGQPFPLAHSAYWQNADVYRLIRDRIPRAAR